MFINDNLPQSERLEKLNKIAIQQMQILENVAGIRFLEKDEEVRNDIETQEDKGTE